MGSGYCGEPNLGSERSSSSGSSRKGRKGNSDKPKQPQRGLGVAQLEKIRLHSQMGCSSYLPSVQNPYSPNLSQEDVRLQTAYSSSSSFSYSTPSSSSYGFPSHQNIGMGTSDLEGRANIRYGDAQPSEPTTTTRWPPGNTFFDYSQQYAQPNMTRQLLDLQVEDSYEKRRKRDGSDSSSHNSESNCREDLDLELRLSL
ncbi:protein SPEAR3-like [Coffea arabica]|uniref:Protein SPEAR3-like n=1 Tax=Coffea arabica TaxID=13443 RepID=A0ABM4UNC9_COFAR